MDNVPEMEYDAPLVPHIVIEDSEDEDKKEINTKIRSIGPEVSLIPIRKKPEYEYNYSHGNHKVEYSPRNKSPRQQVRLVSNEEAIKGEVQLQNNTIKRKSSPLEKCPICLKFFRRMKTHLQKHREFHVDGSSQLTCSYCNKSFNNLSNLSIHMRTHTGDKPYICSVCHKGFAQSCNLVNHIRVHTGEKPFKCPHCDRAFTQSGNLSNHIRLHTDEKPFQCHFCDKAFVQSGNLNSHIKNNHKYLDNTSWINSTDMYNDTKFFIHPTININ